MGLLDEAIREHLDLKRRRGADPGEVERQEQEALGPPGGGGPAAPEEDADVPAAVAAGPDAVPDEAEEPLAPPPARAPVADEEPWLEDEVEPVPAEQVTTEFAPPQAVEEEEGEPPGEDVLEETPEFLQETPEHDRLWFEQRPPRDFDFDK